MGLMILSGDFCDFCNNRGNLKWTYKVRPFEMFTVVSEHGIEKHVSGDWGACDACYKLIEADNFDGLIMRAIDEQKISDDMREEMYDCLTELYNMFKEHRIGSVIRE